MVLSPHPRQTNTWVKATWEESAAAMDDPQYDEGRGYFDHGYMRTEDDSTLLRWLMETLA